MPEAQALQGSTISVFVADDNLIVREGVRALIALEKDFSVVGTASDYDELVAKASELAPQVVVTDIRMPPTFHQEGIEAAHEIRKRHPGTGIVVLSQFDDPEYAISLLGEGSAGYAYLLKDRVAEGDQLARAVRAVASGGSVLDPAIVEAMVHPVTGKGELTLAEEELLRLVAEGRPIKAIAAVQGTTPSAAADAVERLFLRMAEDASSGGQNSLRRLRSLYEAIVNREEQGETLSRLLPGGVAQMLREQGCNPGETRQLVVSVLMSDIRGYSTIAEKADPSVLARQLNVHRGEMNKAIIATGGTVMQFVGDAVMAVFGAPVPMDDHAGKAVEAALAMHEAQRKVNSHWRDEGLPFFELGHRHHHRPGGGRLARLGAAPRVHPGRRHGQPVPASAAMGGAGRDRPVRNDLRSAFRSPTGTGFAPRPGEGPGDARLGVAPERRRRYYHYTRTTSAA